MNGLSDSIAWPSRDPAWVSKVVLNGLILLIPVVGQIVALGWMLAALDNLRAGSPLLPPAGFVYLGRGLNLFVVYLVYGLALTVVAAALLGAGFGITLGSDGRAALLGLPLMLLGDAVLILGTLVLTVLSPAIIVATERGGIGGGLDPRGLMRMLRADLDAAVQAGLFALISSLIGSLGAVLCFVGALFTVPYGYAVLAGVAHHYERHVGPVASPTAA